jgi:tetratricopeptide (TPR) repeat protein
MGNDEKEQQKRTVATTWALNFSDVQNTSPASAELLRLSAFLAPDAIPLELLERGAAVLPEPLAKRLAEAAEDSLVLDELLKPLLRFSLVRRDEENLTYSIHPLVQEVVRDGLSKEKQNTWAERATKVVNSAFPDVTRFENWPACDRLLPHALSCAEFINLFLFEFAEAAQLLNHTAYYLDDRGEYARSELLFRRVLAISEKAQGSENPATAATLNNLANLYVQQGRYKDAEPIYRRALEIYEKIMGPEHPFTATSLNNLAALNDYLGRNQEAEILYYRALAICEKVKGLEHPDTASSLSNLALLLKSQERYAEAEPLYHRALAIREKTLNSTHPDIANSLNNLAMLYAIQGQLKEAEPLYRRALEICQKTLGPEHPHTILVRNNLTRFYRRQGRTAEADALEKGAKGKAK